MINAFSFFLMVFCAMSLHSFNTVLINPGVSSVSQDRNLFFSYEKGVVLKFSRALGQELGRLDNIKVSFSRKPGEDLTEFQLIGIANRFSPNIFVNINAYQEESSKPKIYIYYLIYNELVDLFTKPADELFFPSLYEAHFASANKSSRIAKFLAHSLKSSPYDKLFDCIGAFGIPIKPLRGLICPSISIEIGLPKEDDYKLFIEPLVAAINDTFNNY